MRAAGSPFRVGASTFSRTYRPVAVTGWVDTSAVLPRAWTTVVQVVPSPDTARSKSRVFQPASSPPAPAWRTTNDLIWYPAPRSTRSDGAEPSEHHLSVVPPDTEPLTAFSGPSPAAH